MTYEQTIKMLQTAIKHADNATERAVYISELVLMDKRKILDQCNDYSQCVVEPAKDYDTLSSAVAYLHRYMDCNRESMDADDLGHLAVTLKNLVTMMTESL